MAETKMPVLVVMAAGLGSRYGGLKQIDALNETGEILLDYSLYDAYMAGFQKVIFIIKHEIEDMFKEKIEGRVDKYMEVEYAYQELDDLPEGFEIPEGRIKPWGTAHAIYSARKLINGPFAVINADDYYGPEAFHKIFEYLIDNDNSSRYAMVSYKVQKTLTENGSVSRGVCELDKDGMLANVTERTKISWQDGKIVFTEDGGESFEEIKENTPVSMNFWGFGKGFIDEISERFPVFLKKILKNRPTKDEYPLPSVVAELIKEGKASVKVLTSSEQWYGVTYKEDKEDMVNALQAMKDQMLYPELFWI